MRPKERLCWGPHSSGRPRQGEAMCPSEGADGPVWPRDGPGMGIRGKTTYKQDQGRQVSQAYSW